MPLLTKKQKEIEKLNGIATELFTLIEISKALITQNHLDFEFFRKKRVEWKKELSIIKKRIQEMEDDHG